MKKVISILLCLQILIHLASAAIAPEEFEVTLNGQSIEMNQPPVIINDRTLVPLRDVCERLGADVYWYAPMQGIAVIKNEIKLFFTIGKNQFEKMVVNNFSDMIENIDTIQCEEISLDVPPQIINDRTFLPVRAVCEALGAEVYWNESANTVEIICAEEFINNKNTDTTFFEEYIKYEENQRKQWREKQKDRYRKFDYTVTVTVSGFKDYDMRTATRKLIEARLGIAEYIGANTMDMTQKDCIVVLFGYNEGFDIDKFLSMLTADAKFYITDANENIIIDKSDVISAKPLWNGQNQSFDIEVTLSQGGRRKFTAATEKMAQSGEANYMLIYLDDNVISAPRVMDKIDSDKLVISGIPDSYAYLIDTKGIPEYLKIDVEIESNR